MWVQRDLTVNLKPQIKKANIKKALCHKNRYPVCTNVEKTQGKDPCVQQTQTEKENVR